jgi:DNA-directed RNA polymerase specialized sigma24 family protein
VRRSEPTPPAPSEAEGHTPYQAFQTLYQATIGSIAFWLYRLKVPDRDWDDAIQEVYLEAWRVWSTYDSGRGTHRRWLRGITVNVASRCRERRRLSREREEPWAEGFDAASASPTGGDYMEMNDRARFTVRFFEAIDTLPLVIMIAHDMDDEPMKEIASRHNVSLSEAYKLRNQARQVFTDGYNREQEQRRKSGALILPFGALSLLHGPHEIPEVSADFKEHHWTRIARAIGMGAPPPDRLAPSHDPPSGPRSPAVPHGGRSAMLALRSALVAHPIAAPAVFFLGGALAALGGERLIDALARSARAATAQEAPAANGAEVPVVSVVNVSPIATGADTEPPASSNAEARPETAPAGDVSTAEAVKFDTVRAAFKSPEPEDVLKAIQDYFKSYPRGHFTTACERMRIQTLIRAGRFAEARMALDGLRKRSPQSALLKELESIFPGP